MNTIRELSQKLYLNMWNTAWDFMRNNHCLNTNHDALAPDVGTNGKRVWAGGYTTSDNLQGTSSLQYVIAPRLLEAKRSLKVTCNKSRRDEKLVVEEWTPHGELTPAYVSEGFDVYLNLHKDYMSALSEMQESSRQRGECIEVNGKCVHVKNLSQALCNNYNSRRLSDTPLLGAMGKNAIDYRFRVSQKGVIVTFVVYGSTNTQEHTVGEFEIPQHATDASCFNNMTRAIISHAAKNNVKLYDSTCIIWDAKKRAATKKAHQASSQSVHTVSAVQRILDRSNKLIGLILSDGTTRTYEQCVALAKEGKIRNLKAVTREGKKPYLQGNGISLDAIPSRVVYK